MGKNHILVRIITISNFEFTQQRTVKRHDLNLGIFMDGLRKATKYSIFAVGVPSEI
jgi:hypothetical protein